MTTLVNTSVIGVEKIQRAALMQIFDGLDAAMTAIESIMDQDDAIFFAHMGQTPAPTVLERVAPENFYAGHVPSLINATIDRYPNVSCIVPQATPGMGSDTFDQGEIFRNALFVDVMVKSQTSEEDVNRRCVRTVEAVNNCITSDLTLGGIVYSGLEGAPGVLIGDVFTRKERTSYGPHWFWQGARLEYAVRKEAVHPSSAGSFFRADRMSMDIDQA